LPSIITLTTDFGLKDFYVGAVKGVILGVNPHASVVDISHSLSAGDIMEGAFVMAGACPYFPSGAVHVGVVDPGVGTSRRGVIVETRRGFFVGPDNGLLSLAAEKTGIRRVFEITKSDFCRVDVSATFHGRDIFGPVAAYLTLGIPPEKIGLEIRDFFMISLPEPTFDGAVISGEILHVDTYGNLISNIKAGDLEESLGVCDVEVTIKGRSIKGLYRTYGDIPEAGAGALMGSSGFMEAAAREANAAKMLGIGVGEKVRIVKI